MLPISKPIVMSSSSSHLFLFFFSSVILILSNTPSATCKTNFFSCSQAEFPSNSNFETNLNLLLTSLNTTTSTTGFSNNTIGDSPADKVYGLALCRGDLTPTECQPCIDAAIRDVLDVCPGKFSGAVWYDECRLRYADGPFFSTLTPDPTDPYYYSFRRVPDLELFKQKFEKLMVDLQGRATDGQGKGLFAAGSINYTGSEQLYGMVQCTRDLSGEQCSQCLVAPIKEVLCCLDSEELTFQGGSCYLRYGFSMFYNPAAAGSSPSSENAAAGGGAATTTGLQLGKNKSKASLVLIIFGAAILAVLLAIIIRVTKKRKVPKHIQLGGKNLQLTEGPGLKFHRMTSKKISFFHNQRSPDSPLLTDQKLDLQTVRIATENFSDTKRVGRGEFGPVYKGDYHGKEIAVKRLTGYPKVGLEELKKEFKSIKQLQHPNLVKLLTYHIEEDEKLLVYEFMPNTSLDRVLFDQKRRVLLDWGRRYKIIEGIGRGLLHLHEDSGLNIIHQSLKASNILLDKNMTPKISDIGLAKLFNGSQSQGSIRKNAASQGYSEYGMEGQFSAKMDIFSYGVLVLEIVTGQRNRDFLGAENATNLLSYVWQYWKEEKALQVLDWSLGELYKAHEVLRCIHVGLLCVQNDVENRPNMSTIVQMLNSYSFTLPSPATPSTTKVRKPSNSDLPPRSGSSGNWDWKVHSQNGSQRSPQSPNVWTNVALDSSRGQNTKRY